MTAFHLRILNYFFKKKVSECLKIKIKLSFIKCLHFKKPKDRGKVNMKLKKDTCLQLKIKLKWVLNRRHK